MHISDQWRSIGGHACCWLTVFGVLALIGCGGSNYEAPAPAAGDSGAAGQAPGVTPNNADPPPANAQAVAVDDDEDRKGNSRSKREEEETASTPQPGPSPANPRRFELRHGDPDDEDQPQPVAGSGTGAAEVAVTDTVLRPENVEAWTEEDFLSAARERDARLLAAIDSKVKSNPGDAGVALLLMRILDPDSAAPGDTADVPSQPAPDESDSGKDAPPAAIPPQSYYDYRPDATAIEIHPAFAVDSVTAMLLEASVGYAPQGAAVGAVASGVQERIGGGSGKNPDRIADDESGLSSGRKSRREEREEEERNEGRMSPNSPANGFSRGSVHGGSQAINQFEDRELLEHVVDGLIANGSQNAWQAIYGIVAGTVKSPLAAEASCQIVVERLFQKLDSNPDVIQPVLLTFLDSSVPIPAENRQACLRIFAAISAGKIDTLTGFAGTAPQPAGAPGAPNGFSGAAAGNGFVGGLGRRGRDRDIDDDGAFIPRSGNAFGANGFGGNVAGAAAAQPDVSSLPVLSMTPEAIVQGGDFLWSAKAISAIIKQLDATTDLTTATDLVLLASTIPVTEVRQTLCETFARLHSTGAESLNTAGLFTEVHDPALIVVLKSLPRTRPQKETPGIMDSWTSGTESLILSLRNKIRAASGNMKPYADTLPVKLHKNATAETSVMMEMPAGSAATSENTVPAATQVYYIRTNFTPQKQRDIEDLTSHYEGRTSGFSRPDAPKGVMWIEGVKTLPNGHRRSLDVVIEKSGTGGSAGAFIVEIIVVDTQDPKVPGRAETTQAASEK
ncbi:MAG: hypothetical protein KDB01_00735 [Planctomycetaceae bacterium]|nr:hypothetical protein [Planctomycetaceae bacterium]